MAQNILRCTTCKSYGISEKCDCGGTRMLCKPPKYSPEDKYGKYRRMAKEQQDSD